ncbi:protein of unknown function [Petrocella atlantisensis]|uniref:Uncharacterized protein n=1 Tax=Petrocella atlantisensis TaxID=2173034 RepID=A0A3P7Q001_9FIRM|nr:protein of unknown function [Petrocella atlantisensis]
MTVSVFSVSPMSIHSFVNELEKKINKILTNIYLTSHVQFP